ncbi:MAG: hypothetical protein EBW15_06925 [Actinobacteria bacterium]|jgi:hypothetical protein|nr:hypothetical protein [Actinomycetota bacterium]
MTYLQNDDYINYENGSQHPFRGGGLYLGRVTAVDAGKRASVRIPSLGLTLRSCPVVGTTPTLFLSVGDSVICAFLENDNQEVVVIGRINISLDVYATKTEFVALTNAVQALEARVSALENQ